jgi:predicted acylesterase/phospholipase RssA
MLLVDAAHRFGSAPQIPTMPLMLDLALEGGGSRGIALNAAVVEMLRRGHGIRRLVGTSAGAIVAALVAAGFSVDELVPMSVVGTPDDLSLLSECVTEPLVPMSPDTEPTITDVQLMALKLPTELGHLLLSARAALAFLDRGGFISGEGFVGWLMRVLEGKQRGLSRATLGELHARTGCHLTVIVTDTTARRLRALNHISAPDCPLVSAVRMSISIPLFFTEVLWRAEWGFYAGEDLTDHVMVDGGMLSNLPIGFIMPSTNSLVARLMGPPLEGAATPVGLVLDTTLEVPGAPPAARASSALGTLSATRLGQRITALADTMLNGMDLTVSDSASPCLCRLPAKGYGVTEFDMSQARAEALVSAATAATAAYLDELEARAADSA